MLTAIVYYVILYAHRGFSLVKDCQFSITSVNDPCYNPWRPVFSKAESENLEIKNLEYWIGLYSKDRSGHKRVLK